MARDGRGVLLAGVEEEEAMSHKDRMKAAVVAVEELFSDTSVSPAKTRDSLENLVVLIEGYLEALPR